MNQFRNIIKEICQEENIKLTTISKDWINILEKNNQIHYLTGYKFDLNTSSIATILDDKYAFYELMQYKGYPVIEHTILFKNYEKEKIKTLFNKYQQKVVIKANSGSCGREVFYENNLESLYNIIDELLVSNYSISLSPFIDIKQEYRVIVLNGNVELIYGKIKPVVTCDGIHSIKELLISFNPAFFTSKKDLSNEVFEKGTIYEYNWKFNLSKGATMTLDIAESLKEKLIKIAKNITKDINVQFCSVDIIEDINNNLMIMEANSGVMMDNFIKIHPNGYKIAKNIYQKAIKSMFKNQ